MNMILHGIEAPNVVHINTLSESLQDITPNKQHDIILANPPFGGKERPEVQQNFPIKTGETAFLFLQHFIKSLKPGGRAAIVIKNTFLSKKKEKKRRLGQKTEKKRRLDQKKEKKGRLDQIKKRKEKTTWQPLGFKRNCKEVWWWIWRNSVRSQRPSCSKKPWIKRSVDGVYRQGMSKEEVSMSSVIRLDVWFPVKSNSMCCTVAV
jgi:hypothetical protein